LRYLPASEVVYQLTVARTLQPPGIGQVHAVTWADIRNIDAAPGPMTPDLPPQPAHLITPDASQRERAMRKLGIGMHQSVPTAVPAFVATPTEEHDDPEPPAPKLSPDRPDFVAGLEADTTSLNPRIRMDWDHVAISPMDDTNEAPSTDAISPLSKLIPTNREENDQ
ncbi:MAG: hypothetical protein ACYCT0_07175, partial [Sulfobacillus sp.]